MRTIRRTAAAGSIVALALTMTACGGSDDENNDSAGSTTSSSAAEPSDTASSEMPSDDASSDGGQMAAADQVFGPGCKLVPKNGDGSFDGMATAPVATAASANPLLTTLVKAVGAADLVDTLNSAPALTVFAPTNDAFNKIPKKQLNAVLKDKKTLTTILTHHVIGEQLAPDQLAGTHKTLAGDMLKVTGSGENFKVGPEKATVLCGNVPTANATVYVIDTVLMPKM